MTRASAIDWLHLDRVDSTNDEARRRLAQGDLSAPTCIVAREQTSGRGTRGRAWASPRDAGLYFSLVVPGGASGLPVSSLYPLAAGVACAGVLRARTGADVRLKPVNDLLVDGRKLGGVLAEGSIVTGRLSWIIVGVGINLRAAPREVGDGLAPVALTELLDAAAPWPSEDALTHAMVEHLHDWLGVAGAGDAHAIRAAWEPWAQDGAVFPA